MNAYELADEFDWMTEEKIVQWCNDVVNMLRQQADRIAELEKGGEVAGRFYWESVVDGHVMAIPSEGTPHYNKDDFPLYTTPQIKELSDEEIKPLLDRIQNYLECGGFFNPECMEHDKVRDLIMDCRAILKKASEK